MLNLLLIGDTKLSDFNIPLAISTNNQGMSNLLLLISGIIGVV